MKAQKMEPCRAASNVGLEDQIGAGRVCMPVVKDLHYFDEEQDPDPPQVQGRSRVRIVVKGRVWIRITVKGRIRIRIKVMRNRNTAARYIIKVVNIATIYILC